LRTAVVKIANIYYICKEVKSIPTAGYISRFVKITTTTDRQSASINNGNV